MKTYNRNITRVSRTPDKDGHSNTQRKSNIKFYLATSHSGRKLVVRGNNLENNTAIVHAHYFLDESLNLKAINGKEALAEVVFHNASVVDTDEREVIL